MTEGKYLLIPQMAENSSTELNKFVFFCLLLIQVAVSEIIFEERFEGIPIFFSVLIFLCLLYIYILIVTICSWFELVNS